MLAAEAFTKSAAIKYAIFDAELLAIQPRLADQYQKCLAANIPAYIAAHHLFHAISDTKNSQGIILVAAKPASRPVKDSNGFYIVCDRVQDPGNLGTILRTAKAAGVTSVILTPETVDAYNPKVVRAAMGAGFSLPIYEAADNDSALAALKELGLQIYVAAANGALQAYDVDFCKGTAIIMGSEAAGADDFWRSAADNTISLPMQKGSESLNVAMAAGIIMYEQVRQKLSLQKQQLS